MNASRLVMQPLSKLSQLSHAQFRYAAYGGSECLKSGILVRCTNCNLTVHELCYDVSENINDTNWLCDRCQKNILPTVNTKYIYKLHDICIVKDNLLSDF